MQTKLSDTQARRWSLRVALLGLLATLIIGLGATISAQEGDQPDPPHWFWGIDATSYAGASVVAIDPNGNVVSTPQEGAGIVLEDGRWFVTVDPEAASRVKLRLIHEDETRETDYLDVVSGGITLEGLSISEFSNIVASSDTISVRIIAKRAEDGRIEFGMRDASDQEFLPRARYFPQGGPGHSRWLRSTEIDFGGGFVGRIIARYDDEDGRTEFGFRVEGYPDIFPRARFFPATGPDHDRWLRSSEIEISMPR